MKTALVCVAKNEANYIDEWIAYHLKIGFDDIHIIQNNWRHENKTQSASYHIIDGYGKQVDSYRWFLNEFRKRYDWIAFFDVDEFLVLKKHIRVSDFLCDYSDYAAVSINWMLFGDNNLTFDGVNYSVLKRFIMRAERPDKLVKTIVNTVFDSEIELHNISIGSVDPSLRQVIGSDNLQASVDIAQLNHYFCKTRQEFEEKRFRGRADVPRHNNEYIRLPSDFDDHNYNQVEDTLARDFLYKDN